MLKYPANVFVADVEESNIIVQDREHQLLFSLTIDNMEQNNERFVTVISLHSNGANRKKSDIVTNQMIRYLSKQSYQEMTFVHLFPYASSSAEQLYEMVSSDSFERVLQENVEVIRSFLRQSTTVILAWGARPAYIPMSPFKKAVESIKRLLIEEQCTDKTNIFEFGHTPELSTDGQPNNPYRLSIDRIKAFNVERLVVK